MFETTDELLRQIRLGEDSALELKDLRYKGDKISTPHRNSMADELAAMANSASGVLVLGVDDRSRAIVGIPESKLSAVDAWVDGICNDLIEPPLQYRLRKLPVTLDDGADGVIVRLDVPKSLYVHQSPGGYLQRRGTSKRKLTTDMLARLIQQRGQTKIIRFDEQACGDAHPDCLDKDLWKKFRTSLSPEDDSGFLTKLGLLTRTEEGEICPSVSGLLMASRQPQKFLPGAFIQAVSYRGVERNAAYQLDAQDITGSLDIQIRDACKFVEKNMNVFAIKNPNRIETPQFSMNAVFEAVANAVAHRDYSVHGLNIRLHLFSDRMEISSPGAIPNTITVESISERQAARNELISSLLARCPMNVEVYGSQREFIMDRRGEGVPIIITESERLSGRRPEYRLLDDAELKLTIYAAHPPSQAE